MTTMKRLAAALVAVLSLSACAVTGQPARPGTAATYNGATITTAQVAAWGTAQDDMGYPNDPGAVLSLLMLRPALDKEAAIEGIVFDDKQISDEAQLWMKAGLVDVVPPTPDMMDVVRTVHSFGALAVTKQGAAAIQADLRSIEASAQVNPVYGDFTYDRFLSSVNVVAQAEQDQSAKYGSVSYLVFRDVSGFAPNAHRSWMVGAGLPSPSASPAPVNASPAPASPSPKP